MDSSPDSAASPRSVRPQWMRVMDWLLGAVLVGFVLSQIWVWGIWERPSMGDSLRYLITQFEVLVSVLILLGWWFFMGPASVRTRLLTGIPVVLLLAGWAASIRKFEFTGDMRPVIEYRWSRTGPAPLPQVDAQLADSLGVSLPITEVPEPTPEDMPAYRGLHRDGLVTGPPLAQNWNRFATPDVWRVQMGGGYASMAIVGPLLVTLDQRGNEESILCYQTKRGDLLWEKRYPAFFFEAMGGPGPRSTPTIDGDAVYSFGAYGDLFCLDLLSGNVRWHVNSLQQFGVPNTTWAMTSSPLIDEDRVIVNIGGMNGNGLAAYDKKTGQLRWHSAGIAPVDPAPSRYKTGSAAVEGLTGVSVPGYASPTLETLHGDVVILNFDGMGLHANDRLTGKELFFYPFTNQPRVNVAQPIVFPDGRIFISASYDEGSAMLKTTREGENWSVEKVWANKELRCKFTSPILHEGYLYGLDEGIMVCLDPETGKQLWKGGKNGLRGRYQHGQILVTNGQLLALSEDGEAVLANISPQKLEQVTVLRVLAKGKNWNAPALVRGRLYARSASEMVCVNLNVDASLQQAGGP